MIKQFYFKNFKCFKDARINVENVTFLIGTNASGKTNAIEGMMILSELVTGRDISAILDGSKNVEGMIRGGAKGCGRLGNASFGLGCLIQYNDQIDIRYEIEILVSERAEVKAESLTEIKDGKERMMFQTKAPVEKSGDISVTCNNGRRGKNPDISCIRFSSVISQIISKLSTETQYGKRIVSYANTIVSGLHQILFLSPETHLMRSYASINDYRLKVDASNISAVLFKLCEANESKKILLDIMRSLPENEIMDIEFEKGPLNDVILFLDEKYGNGVEKVDAMRLSDGTLRCLAIMAALLSVEKNSMVVIEEFDNGVHPGRAKELVRVVSRVARERDVDVVITTHNAVMLNALSKEDIMGVNVVYREDNGDGSIMPFISIPNMPRLLASGKLGDVFSNDEILNYIKGTLPRIDYSWLEV